MTLDAAPGLRIGRLLLVLAGYATSWLGLMGSIAVLGLALAPPRLQSLLALPVLLAWLYHLLLCLDWVLGRRARRGRLLRGTVCGLTALLTWPLAGPFARPQAPVELEALWQPAALAGLATLPCVLLATWIVATQWRTARTA